jgi:23S rRNA (uracil1939-C5)-methyltransferase
MIGDVISLRLEKMTYGGDALGRLEDGRAVFVPFGLPGETVRARIVQEKRGHVRAELLEVLAASPERIAPKCRHFMTCGGCHYQHLAYEAQLAAKTEILRDQLQRIGRLENPPVGQMVPAPREWYYRNHLQFHLTRDGKLGFVRAGFDPAPAVFAISECRLPEASLNDLWPDLRFDPGLGLERVSLRAGTEGEAMLILESAEPPELEMEADLSVVHLLDGESVVMAGDDYLFIAVNERPFRVSAASFFQVNTEMAGRMVSHLLEHLPVTSSSTLLDVYCGVGLFSAFFAPRIQRLIGIEVSPSACQDFAANLDEFDNVELYEGAAEDILPYLDIQPDTAIVDPPRAGLEKRALDALLAHGPARLAYVSCDPSTLGRDAARLIAGGYRLVSVTPFDLFPQTYHIESISIFSKEDAR